jgi:hypothetical protein
MRFKWKVAIGFGFALCASSALASISKPCNGNFKNWPNGTLNIGEVIPVNGKVTFTYNNGFLTNAQLSFTVNPANLGPFSTTVPGFINGAPLCVGLANTNIPVTGFLGDKGFVRGKYQVVEVYYAPPGSKSTVTYGSSFSAGTTTNVSSSFDVANNVSLSVTNGQVGGVTGDKAGGTVSTSWGYGTSTSSSTSLTSTQGNNLIIPGPASSNNGIDHTQDIIWIWLNPSMGISVFPGAAVPILVTSVNFDATDPDGMDIYPISVASLNILAAGGVPTGVDMARLGRAWSATGALTPADYATILAADPFVANPSFNPSADASYRFDSIGETINYTPAGSGGQPIITQYASSYQTTTMNGETASNSYSVGISFDGTVSWQTYLSAELKASTTWTWKNMWGSSLTNTNTQSANFSIASPLSTDGYAGPTAITVWKDNVYGSFMFYGAL